MLKFTFLKEENSMSTFEDCIDKVLEHEGGYVNDPKDLGGETNFGISKRAYPDVDIKALTKEDAKAIYKKDYWKRYKIEKMPERLRYIYFDMVLNMGSGNAAKVVQRAANAKNPASERIKVDGAVGPMTRKALKNVELERVRSERVLHYARLVMKKPEQHRFWFGWFRRSLEV
tara:strand:- start:1208 stop:1726 length:519 start_codon:yes stop_codon:yes gene_type:complete